MAARTGTIDPEPAVDRRRTVPVGDVTIASVVYGEWPTVEHNRRLTARLNPGAPVRWRVVRNLPVQEPDRDAAGDDDLELVDGEVLSDELRATTEAGSHHHALGLRAACQDVGTRYLVVIDPDCFVVRRNWIEDVLTHMDERGLAFFGTPYHPRSLAKLRYFPCGIFLVVDTSQVPVATLDWAPDAPVLRPGPLQAAGDWFFRRIGWLHRLRYELSRDTGIKIYRHYRAAGAPAECVQPVMVPEYLRGYEMSKEFSLSPMPWFFEKVLPDRYCMVPKKRGYVTDRTFADFGYEDTARTIWAEEFLWRDEPFALHLRSNMTERREQEAAQLDRVLGQFA